MRRLTVSSPEAPSGSAGGASGTSACYHNEVLARGLAAAGAKQYLEQRLRWGTGAMQVLRVENPAFVRGLSLMQRVSYLPTLLGWFEAWRTLVTSSPRWSSC